ncbi:hypothetical protein F511_31458 [Dorcoceras hygrometricum]|uniref:Uncharacterized protein n=1 Tax=Dorcoceras hygrometricum TaxID=472368 RepID=A0A2Z7BKU5_9LAMI|nr:hypothetical protein F511_31458 [Dorcoceras hygrometricum]
MLVELFPVLSCSDLDRGWRVVGPLAIPCDLAGGSRAGAAMSHSIFHWVRSGLPGYSAGLGVDLAGGAPGGV